MQMLRVLLTCDVAVGVAVYVSVASLYFYLLFIDLYRQKCEAYLY